MCALIKHVYGIPVYNMSDDASFHCSIVESVASLHGGIEKNGPVLLHKHHKNFFGRRE